MSLDALEFAGDRVYMPGFGHGEIEIYDEYEVGIRFDSGEFRRIGFETAEYETIIAMGGPIC